MACSKWTKGLVNNMSDEMCCNVLVTILKRFGWIVELTVNGEEVEI